MPTPEEIAAQQKAEADAKAKAEADAAANAAKTITVKIGGKDRVFANQEELAAELERLNTEAAAAATARAEAARLKAKYDSAIKATGGDREALRELYRDQGASDAQIDAMFKEMDRIKRIQEGREGGEGGEGEADPVGTGEGGARQPAKKLNIRDLDQESQTLVGDLIRKGKNADRIILSQNLTNIRNSLAGDKVIGKYWPHLSDAQKAALMDQARQTADTKLRTGEILEDADIGEALQKARTFAATMWPDPAALETPDPSKPPPLVGRGESDELQQLPDTELDKKDDGKPVLFDGSKEDDARVLMRFEKIRRKVEANKR